MTHRTPRVGSLVGTTCAVAALALLAACGAGGDDTADLKIPTELSREVQGEDQDAVGNGDGTANDGDDSSGDPSGSDRTGTLAFKLPDSGRFADGFAMIDDECSSGDRRGAVITYAVPADWSNTGGGSAGGGGNLEGSIDHRFSTTEGEVTITVAGDRRDEDGNVLDGAGDPSESFDFDYTVGDRTTRVEFASVLTVSLEYQDVEVFSVDEATYPDPIRGEEFRVRFEAFVSEWDLGGTNQTAVMTITAPTGVVDDNLLEAIVTSMQLPECSRQSIIVSQELISSADLDGDGRISDVDDLLEGNN